MPLLTYNELGTQQRAAGSIRENLLDFIEILSPRDTPLYNNLGSIGVQAGFVEYLEDTLVAATVNAWLEGGAATDITLGYPARLYSIVQNFQKHYHVSGRQQAVLHAGMSNMVAYQEMKALREVKTDVELALHRGSAVTGTASVAPNLGGFLNVLRTNLNMSAYSGVTLTEKVFNDIAAQAYNNPVNLREAYMGINLKRTVNQYTTSVTRFLPASDRKSLDIIDVYESEMGVIALFKSRYQLAGTAGTAFANSYICIDPDYFQIGWLRPFNTFELGVDGDRTRKMIVGELTLILRSEKAGVGGVGLAPYIR